MKDELNKRVSKYVNNTKTVNINVESMISSIGSIKYVNDYGNIAHALINYKHNETKILKMLDELFSNGVNPNYQSKTTGYTFLHLAFYGYTTDDGAYDISYSEDFILKLIKLAKKYNFDFNIKDNDGDTILHSCIYSEVYTGSVITIYEAIKDKFDINAKNNEGKNVYEALESAIKEARNNNVWKTRLMNDSDKLKRIVELGDINIENIGNLIETNINSIKELINKLSIDNYNELIDEINDKLNELSSLIKSRNSLNESNETKEYDEIYKELLNKVKNIVNSIIETLEKKPTEDLIAKSERIINEFSLTKQSNKLKEIKDNYNKYIDTIVEKLLNAKTVNEINGVVSLEYEENDKIKNTINDLNSNLNKLLKLIESIKQNKINVSSMKLLIRETQEEDTCDYLNMTEEELNQENDRIIQEYNLLIEKILSSNTINKIKEILSYDYDNNDEVNKIIDKLKTNLNRLIELIETIKENKVNLASLKELIRETPEEDTYDYSDKTEEELNQENDRILDDFNSIVDKLNIFIKELIDKNIINIDSILKPKRKKKTNGSASN